jgi:hypothetical protein
VRIGKHITTLSHDGFARQSLVRRTVHRDLDTTCDYCGCERDNAGLYQYGHVPDGRLSGVADWTRGYFCCKDCWELYHA